MSVTTSAARARRRTSAATMHKRALAGESFVYEQPVGALTFDIMLGPLRDGEGAIIGVIGVGYDYHGSHARRRRRAAKRNAR